jgi:hypothetical protein
MTRVHSAISWATGILLVYVVFASLPVPFMLVFALFLIATAVFLWMVITILKDPRPSNRTFEEYFYEDSDIRRGSER